MGKVYGIVFALFFALGASCCGDDEPPPPPFCDEFTECAGDLLCTQDGRCACEAAGGECLRRDAGASP